MPNSPDIADFLLDGEANIKAGADLRVRPWSPPCKSYGQGENNGPWFYGKQFTWGQPLKAVDGENDPEAGEVSLRTVSLHHKIFMTEARYQKYLNAVTTTI